MIVTNGQLATTLKTVQKKFVNDFDKGIKLQSWDSYVTTVPVTSESVDLSWFGATPVMVDTTDGVVSFAGAQDYDYNLKPRFWQAGLQFKRSWWEKDQLGHAKTLVSRFAQRALRNRGKEILNLASANGNAFDGTAFFANTRVQGASGNIDNTLTVSAAAPTAPTPAEIATGLSAAFVRMAAFADDKGEVLGLNFDTFLVPTQLWIPMYQGLAVGLGNSTDAPLPPVPSEGSVKVGPYTMILNYITSDADKVIALHTTDEVKPFVIAEAAKPYMTGQTTKDIDWWEVKRAVPYVVTDEFTTGYGDPRTALELTFA